MKLTHQQRAYIKAQKQAFKLHNIIFGGDNKEEVERLEYSLNFEKDFGDFFKPYCTGTTFTKDALKRITNPSEKWKK